MSPRARRAVRVPDAIADGCQKNADRGYHYRMDLAVSSGSDDHDSGSGPWQPGTGRSCGASLVHALARTCGALPAWWNQSYPEVGLRGVIGGAAPVEWRGRERANLRDRLTLSVIGSLRAWRRGKSCRSWWRCGDKDRDSLRRRSEIRRHRQIRATEITAARSVQLRPVGRLT